MKKNFIVIIAGLLHSICIFSYSLESKIRANISLTDSAIDLPLAFKMDVKNEFILSSYDEDTLFLKLNTLPKIPAAQIGIQHLKITTEGNKPVPYSFNGSILAIYIHDKNTHFTIEYEILGQNILGTFSSDNFLISEVYNSMSASWYFTHEKMHISPIEITIPPNATLFSNTTMLKNGNNSYLLGISHEDDVKLLVISNRFYNMFSNKIVNTSYNLYLHNTKELDICPDASKTDTLINKLCSKEQYGEEYFKDKIQKYNNCIKKVNSFFNLKDTIFFNIIEFHWGNGSIANGASFSTYMLIDTSFIKGSGFIHEYIHIIDPLNEYYQTADSAKYLFSESMIEYLSHYIFYYDDLSSRDYIENTRMVYYSKENQKYTSIFQVRENIPETQPIIYSRTPFVIKEFALKVGEKIFTNALMEFYKLAKNKETVSLNDFVNILQSNGVNETDINEFINQL